MKYEHLEFLLQEKRAQLSRVQADVLELQGLIALKEKSRFKAKEEREKVQNLLIHNQFLEVVVESLVYDMENIRTKKETVNWNKKMRGVK